MKIILSLSIGGLLTINIANAQFFRSFADLEETPYSSTTPENFYRTEPDSAMRVYNSLRAASWGDYMFLQEHSSDAIFAPTRGMDWYDEGRWQELQLHTWTPTLGFANGAWVNAYTGIAMANSTIDSLESLPSDPLLPTLIAEARYLRALYYWWLLDLFRNVPLVTDPTLDPDNPPAQNTPQEVFNFIVAEINAALPDLEESFGEENYGRATKGAANALLATVYLNAEVYTGTAMWQETVDACDAVMNSGQYALMSTFNDVFALENEGTVNTENILVVEHEPEEGVTSYRHMATLHFSQLPASPWNGFSVMADFYNKYDPDDNRADSTLLLIGQQYVLGGQSVGDSAYTRYGDPLVFTNGVKTGDFLLADESDGVRMLKWPIDPDMNGWYAGNDYAIFRYSHILLAKAEALYMLGSTADALDLVNQVRERNFDPPKPLTTITLDDIFDERGYEFLWEGFRRQDLIRTGHWSDTWSLHETPSADYTKLFPIPQRQLDVNPNLVQNDGYGVDAVLSVSPLSIDFGDVLVGKTNTDHVTVTNTGTPDDLHVSMISISGDNAANFSVDTTPFTLAPDESLFLDVNFAPDDAGSFSASLYISSDAGNASIELDGVGFVGPIPYIISITDVPDDQGGWVFLNWFSNQYDALGGITQYGIWELNSEDEWVALGNVPAIQENSYIYLAHTFGDSTDEGIFWSTFMVTAHTTDPEVFYTSPVDSGYSVDNLAPAVPTGLLAFISENITVALSWDQPVDEDFNYFKIYRSLEPDFDPTGTEPLYVTIDANFTDSKVELGETYYYRLSAVDFNGNESEYSEVVEATVLSIDENNGIPTRFGLSQNYPNPFNPVTTISYQLPKSAFVNLTIYNVAGQLVETLINEHNNAGFYTIEWDAKNVGSGIYFYRIEAGEYNNVKKCVVVK